MPIAATARVLAFVIAAIAGILPSACTSTRSLTPSERRLVFTVDTLREGGVLVPIPFEERYVTEQRTMSPGGGASYAYVFDPPHDIGFPVFLQSEASIYNVPGHALYAGAVLSVSLTFAGIDAAETIDVTSEFPNLADEASLLVFRDQGGQVGAFILTVRKDRRALNVALAGPPASDPEMWFGPARRCLKQLEQLDESDPAQAPRPVGNPPSEAPASPPPAAVTPPPEVATPASP